MRKNIKVVSLQEQREIVRRRSYHQWLRTRRNGTTILLGLEGYKVGKVIQEEKGIVVDVVTELIKPVCLRCDSAKLYRHGRAKRGGCLTRGVKARR